MLYLLISRILHTVYAVPAEKLYDKTIQIFRSRADYDLVWAYRHPPELIEIIRNGLSEFKYPTRRRSLHKLFPVIHHRLPHELRPCRKWEVLTEGGIVHKVGKEPVLVRGFCVFPDHMSMLCHMVFRSTGIAGIAHSHNIRILSLHVTHIEPALRLGINISLSQELTVCVFHCDDAHIQMSCKRPL